MGAELAQGKEWNHDESLAWHDLEHTSHQGLQRWIKDLNHFYRTEPALYELDFETQGFEWIDFHDGENSVISYVRKGRVSDDMILVLCNFTPIPRRNYCTGVPRGGVWKEVLNSDAGIYWGSGEGNLGKVEAASVSAHGRDHSLTLVLPPLSALFFKSTAKKGIFS